MDRLVKDDNGNGFKITSDIASEIQFQLRVKGYIDKKGILTDKYYEDKANGEIKVAEEVQDYASDVIKIIDSIYDSKALMPENARSNNVELTCDEEKLNSKEFKALWSRINSKSVYVVDFDTDELVKKVIAALNSKLRVSKIYFKVETGQMNEIKSKQDLLSGTPFVRKGSGMYDNATQISVNHGVKYDLVGKYNPDWAIAFREGNIKHIYFVVETKGSMSSMQLRLVEEAKIHFAREHFKAISGDDVVYDDKR